MNKTLRRLALVLTLHGAVATTAHAQQIIELTNGDRLTGLLARIDGTTWVYKHAAGELRVGAADVASFTAPAPIGMRLSDGTILAGTIAQANGRLQVTGSDGSIHTVAPTALAAVGSPDNLRALEPVRIGYFRPISRFWGATAGLGYSDKSGNSRSRGLGADFEVGRRSPRDRLTLKLGVAVEESDPGTGTLETTVEKYFGSLRTDIFFAARLFAFASTTQERDKFQDIDLRSNYNLGFGVQVLSTDRTDLRFYASGGLRREAFTSNTPTNSTPIVAAGTTLKQALGPAVFGWSLDLAPSVEDLKDYRFVSDAGVTMTVFKGLGFRVASRNEVNNRPSQPGIKKHDMLLTTALTYSIGR
ncbi:MAG TPA: DUF481 domain-containing protein [Gemmatimonadales bacterium]